MITFAVTMLMLGVLIFVHELGHYLAAKSVDIEVKKFSIGFGPKILGFQKGETEYLLSLIPLGGYVSMGGMYDETMEQIEGSSPEENREPTPRDFDAKPIWARAFVLSAGVMMNFGFAFLVYTGVAAFWGSSEIKENRIAQVDFDRLPSGAKRLGQIESGSMLIRIGETVVNDWGDVRDGLLESPDGPLKIVTENPQGTIEIDLPKTQDERLEIFSTLSPWLDNTIGSVNPGSPAETGGLEEGDKVLAIGGVQVENWYNMVNMIRSSPNVRLEFSLVRGGQELTRFVTPESVSEGASDVGRIGATATQPEIVYADVGLIKAVQTGFRETVAVTGLILNSVKELFTAQVSPRELGSIFMIGQAAGQTARLGLEYYLQFVALFSVNLAILNLLPIPVLDGGHLMFLGIEAIRRKPLSLEMKLRFSQIGFFFLIAIMVLALSNDLLRLFG